MLIQFHFKNFKSFRDDIILDFSATESQDNEYRVVKVGDERILTAAGIFGANASGKSNVIKAFRYMTEYVTSSVIYSRDKVRGIKRLTLFLFDNKSKDAESLKVKMQNLYLKFIFRFRQQKGILSIIMALQ